MTKDSIIEMSTNEIKAAMFSAKYASFCLLLDELEERLDPIELDSFLDQLD